MTQIKIPDLGAAAQVIEILVAPGDQIVVDQPLITLEGDKATMEVPATIAGEVVSVDLSIGDTVSDGDACITLAAAKPEATVTETKEPVVLAPEVEQIKPVAIDTVIEPQKTDMVYASPSVRRYAAFYGVDLSRVRGSGNNSRILKSDVSAAIIALVAKAQQQKSSDNTEKKEILLSKIKQISGKFLTQSWQTIPHVTQHDAADLTELEVYRKSLKEQGIKISPLIFMLKAVAKVLQQHPNFNSVLSEDGSKIYLNNSINIGVAVDTPKGLVVPVINDIANKNLLAVSKEVVAIAKKARTVGLNPKEMSGGGFTISSLGGIGGSHFTPIVNMPEVAILGVSKLTTKPAWIGNEWLPRKSLPLSLSYDHRVIDGAEGARFITDLVACLQDPKQSCFLIGNEE